jgi:hypothetical protein
MYAGRAEWRWNYEVTTERSISDTEYGSLGEAMPPTRGIPKPNPYRVTVTYTDNQVSGRVYNNREKAEKFAARQKKSPVVMSMRIEQID